MSVGKRISALRKARKLSQEALGELLGVSFQSVSGWERDENLPDTRKLAELAGVLETTVDHLLTDAPEQPGWTPRDRYFSEERMHAFIRGAATAHQLSETLKALKLSKEAHQGQTRKGKAGVPYIIHPLMMVCHALAMGIRKDAVLAAILLHDVVEDCEGYTLESLAAGEETRGLVRLLTKSWETGRSTPEKKEAYYAQIRENPDAAFIKVLDRANNLSQMALGLNRAKMITFMDETDRYVMPMVEMLKEVAGYNDAMFLVKYQMLSLMETARRLIAGQA